MEGQCGGDGITEWEGQRSPEHSTSQSSTMESHQMNSGSEPSTPSCPHKFSIPSSSSQMLTVVHHLILHAPGPPIDVASEPPRFCALTFKAISHSLVASSLNVARPTDRAMWSMLELPAKAIFNGERHYPCIITCMPCLEENLLSRLYELKVLQDSRCDWWFIVGTFFLQWGCLGCWPILHWSSLVNALPRSFQIADLSSALHLKIR